MSPPRRTIAFAFAGVVLAPAVALGLSLGSSTSPRPAARFRGHVGSEALALLPDVKESAATRAPAVEPSSGGWNAHHVLGTIVFSSSVLSLCLFVPIYQRERAFFDENVAASGDTFKHYFTYRFVDWFTGASYAPGVVLLFLTINLIVVGAVAYALITGGSPSHALWKIFVWATCSSADAEASAPGRVLGCLITVCGIIILSLLLGIVSEIFTSTMTAIKSGRTRVVEGGHVVILGYTDCTRCLLQELAKARESDGGGVFVILTTQDKELVEHQLTGHSMDLRGSRVIVRTGSPFVMRDLQKVAVANASVVMVLADSAASPEDADAKSVRTLLAMQTRGWPQNGRIVVQCCNTANATLFKQLYGADSDKVEVVVIGSIMARLMATSLNQHGLASVFGMILGFEGDEFYCGQWPELVGVPFRDVIFRFPNAVPLGVMTDKGECRLNPGWDYIMGDGDEIIVLAEDDDAYKPSASPWQPPEHEITPFTASDMESKPLRGRSEDSPKILIIGWNDQIGPLLSSLDSALAKGSTVDIYADMPVAEREAKTLKWQELGRAFDSITINQLEADPEHMLSGVELAKLRHYEYAGLVLLAHRGKEVGWDERALMCLTQLQLMNRMNPHFIPPDGFDPVVEMCEDSTAEHLKMCGFTNFVHSSSIVSQALAAVCENPSINSIYATLMSDDSGFSFEFRRYEEFLEHGKAPKMLSFWEATYTVCYGGNTSLVAWTVPGDSETPGARRFVINPKDKTTRRPWTDRDRLVVIRRST